MSNLRGVFPATVTPFSQGGIRVNLGWIPKHLAFLEQGGVDGVVPLGTNGEGPSISLEEKKAIVDAVLAHRGKLRVIVGTGTPVLPDTIELSRYSLERGADAVLIVPPFYFKDLAREGLLSYYRQVLRDLPSNGKVVLYNIPSMSGVEIEDWLVERLAEEFPRQLLGIKDTSGSLEKTTHYARRFPNLLIYAGSDELVGPAVGRGCAGAISAVANVFPGLVKQAYVQALEGQEEGQAQKRLRQVRMVFKTYPQRAALKVALTVVAGLPMSYARPPLVDLAPEQVASLKKRLEEFSRE